MVYNFLTRFARGVRVGCVPAVEKIIDVLVPTPGTAADMWDETTDRLTSAFQRTGVQRMDRGFDLTHDVLVTNIQWVTRNPTASLLEGRTMPKSVHVTGVTTAAQLYETVFDVIGDFDRRPDWTCDVVTREWMCGFYLEFGGRLIRGTDSIPLAAYNMGPEATVVFRLCPLRGGGWFTRSTKVAVTDELGVVLKGVKLVCANRLRMIDARYDFELYSFVDALITTWSKELAAGRRAKWTMNPRYTLFFGAKPLRRVGLPLTTYGLRDGATVKIEFYYLQGGATYTHVGECEQQIIAENVHRFVAQSTEGSSGVRPEDVLFTFGVRGLMKMYPQLFRDSDYLPKLIEDVYILIYNLGRCQSVRDAYMAVITYVKLRDPKSLMQTDVVKALMEYVTDLLSGNQAQSAEDMFSCARQYLDQYDELRKAPVFSKLYKLGMYALSFSLFEKLGVTFDRLRYTTIEAEAIRRKYHMGVDFVHTMLDTLLFLCERGYQCMKTGSLDPIYHGGSSYEQWFDKATKLRANAAYLAFPEAHGFTTFEYLADVNDVIDQGESIHKHAVRMGAFERKLVGSLVAELRMIKANMITKREAQKERDAPFAVLLYGGSSIGKSTLTKALFYQYGKTFDLPLDSEFKFTRNANANFWDGFNSTQWCVQLDDIAFMHPNQATGGDPTVMEMLQVVNNVPFVPDQASLEDKGRTPMRAKFVIATTNCEDLNAIHYFQTPLAAQRRLPYILDVVTKPEYTRDECMLDSSATQVVDGEWPNYWKITVKRVVPVGTERRGQRAKSEVVEVFEEIDDFLAWFSRVAVEHERVQRLVRDCDDGMKNIVICKACYRVESKCKCMQAQAGEVVVSTSWSRYILWWFLTCSFSWYCLGMIVRSSYFCNWYTTADIPVERQRARMIVAGNAEERARGSHRIVRNFALALAGALAAWKLYSTLTTSVTREGEDDAPKQECVNLGPQPKVEVSEQIAQVLVVAPRSKDVGTRPVGQDEKQNVWYKDTFELTTFDASPLTTSWNDQTHEQVCNIVCRNVINIKVRRQIEGGAWKRTDCKAFCVGGNLYVTNNHNVPSDLCEVEAVLGPVSTGLKNAIKFQLGSSVVYRMPERDLVFFRCRAIPPKRDLRGLFSKDGIKGGVYKGTLMTRQEDGEIMKRKLDAYRYVGELNYSLARTSMGMVGRTVPATRVGDCGGVALFETGKGPILAGIHACGDQDQPTVSGVAQITRTDIESAQAALKITVVSEGRPVIDGASQPKSLGDLDKKSVARFIEQGSAQVYGSLDGFRTRGRSDVVPTHIRDAVVEEGYPEKFGKPAMSGYEPWRNAMLEMVNPVTNMDQDILMECVESFKKDIARELPAEAWSEIHVYDDYTAMNGAVGVAYVDKMNRNSSAGNPYKKSKKFFIEPTEGLDGNLDAVKPNAEMQARIDHIMGEYAAGRRYQPVFCGNLKDEPRSLKKIASKQTRVFTGGPMDWTFVVRKYLLSVVRVMQKNKFVFECAPGTNATSTQWGEIRSYLVQHGVDRLVAGDYRQFDKRMCSDLILAAFDILRWMCERAGYRPEDLLAIDCIAADTAYPLVDFHGDLVMFFGSNPSGHPLTVIINGLANSLYVRYTYRVLNPEREVASFRSNVALMTYGDDNVFGVSERVPWFHHTSVQKALADIGVGYTMADKEAESVPYIHIDEVTFLKRSWRWDSDLRAWAAPLDEESIGKMLTRVVKSDTLCPEAQAVAVMESAHSEYFFYGRTIFEEKSKMFQRIVEKCGLEAYVTDHTFPSWNELFDRFWRSSQ